MPAQARANGLWGGPVPEALECFTYAERRVVQLARLYVSVKRVFLDAKSYKRFAGHDEVPRYHEKNVVAYPYNLDLVNQILGVGPTQLADVITVQFVGSDRSLLRREPDLTVSVKRLRAAFAWLAFNSLPWTHSPTRSLASYVYLALEEIVCIIHVCVVECCFVCL